MPPEIAAKHETLVSGDSVSAPEHRDSLFGEFAWFYILCRERIFRDDTERMVHELWPDGAPPDGAALVELGCGPGFYSRRMASRFPALEVLGIDRSRRQLNYAQTKAHESGLENCRFECRDVLDVIRGDATFDAVIASRLLTVLPQCDRVVAEIYRVLTPGGRCFIAEPRYAFWASIPLFMMWILATIGGQARYYREPRTATVFSATQFKALFTKQPWRSARIWQDGRYQYALCEKE